MENLQKKIGIIGGGQLGQMMILEAKKMGFYIITLDPTEKCPSHSISDEHIIADFHDENAIKLLAEKSDVITYEFEHINADILQKLEDSGKKVYPTAKSLKIIQDKFSQKTVLRNNNIPVADFLRIYTLDDMKKFGEKYSYPFMLKSCKDGYDGKGNFLVESENQLEEAFHTLNGETCDLMSEKFFEYTMEISVLACRSVSGEIKVYPVAQNIHHESILYKTLVPASISDEISKKAMDLAENVMKVFEGVGMFCVEMFVGKDGELSVNEVAPRPHNSGHYTIEGCITSQFEQHIRAVSGLPLGSPDLIMPTVMINILGENGYSGKALVKGAEEILSLDGTFLHIYGKEMTKPKRKMGHLTVISKSLDDANKIADIANSKIKIIS